MKIGYRTIKTAIATPIAISLAQFIGVSNALSAGILTILCIQPSRKKSVESAVHRFIACVLSIIFSLLFFELLGYNPIALGLLLAVFIPTTVLFNIEQGILTSTVITLNIYTFGMIKFDYITDQLLLIIIGIGVGLLVNLYMPSLDKQLLSMQKQIEKNFQVILKEIALYIREENMDWGGKEIVVLGDLFAEAHKVVERDKENHIFREGNEYNDYFTMRQKQFNLLKKMLPLVTRLPKKIEISEPIAYFFDDLAKSVHPGNTAIIFLNELENIKTAFKSGSLPTTEEEFETRANLFQLLYEIEEYLIIKSEYKEPDVVLIKKKEKKTKKE